MKVKSQKNFIIYYQDETISDGHHHYNTYDIEHLLKARTSLMYNIFEGLEVIRKLEDLINKQSKSQII